jgi:hypothetical protein
LPAVFGAWLAATAILGRVSGWYELAARYPDRREFNLLMFDTQSGIMGPGVVINGILTLNACPSGLRVRIWRLLGPFSRPFFVPWTDIRVESRTHLFLKMARLGFGQPEVGVLSIEAGMWARLAEAAELAADDPRRLPRVSLLEVARSYLLQWLVITAGAASFLYAALRTLGGDSGSASHLSSCIYFSGGVFGAFQIVRYLRKWGALTEADEQPS